MVAKVTVAFAQQALHRVHRTLRGSEEKLAGFGANNRVGAVGGEVHHRGHDAAPTLVVDGHGLARFGVHVGHEAVGGAQIDADDDFFLLKAAGGKVDSYCSHKYTGAAGSGHPKK